MTEGQVETGAFADRPSEALQKIGSRCWLFAFSKKRNSWNMFLEEVALRILVVRGHVLAKLWAHGFDRMCLKIGH
jgi:hypothetical protein